MITMTDRIKISRANAQNLRQNPDSAGGECGGPISKPPCSGPWTCLRSLGSVVDDIAAIAVAPQAGRNHEVESTKRLRPAAGLLQGLLIWFVNFLTSFSDLWNSRDLPF